ncbi:MAG: precorrin-6y C5,15-methyltransferase (decarboxylating) subunit CbiE, partial [Actinomycetota bacterium]
MSAITVLGVPAVRADSIAERLRDARLVVGGRRHLAAYANSAGAQVQTVEIGAELEPALDAIDAATGPVFVLASGDPGFFGIVRALAERFGRDRLDVVPGVSSVALTFAAIGLPWDDAVVVSAHGRDLRYAVNVALANPKVAILTAPGAGPAEIATELVRTGRTMFVAERLGEPSGGLSNLREPAEIAERDWDFPNVVVVIDGSRAVPPKGSLFPRLSPPSRWALDEDEFEHRDGMVTKAEVRAVVLARLGPGLGDL